MATIAANRTPTNGSFLTEMASRHVRAVQRRHAEYDDTEFRIMQVIATDIGEDDKPAFPSYREIASRTGVHYNTVMARVQALVEAGKLQTERSGRYMQYSLPFEVEARPQTMTMDCDDDCDNHRALSQRLSQLEARLSQLSSQFEAFIVTMPSTDTVTEVKGSIREVRGSIRNARANGAGHETIVDYELEDRRIAMRTAICAAVKTTFVPHINGEEFDSIAAAFVRDGLEPGDVDDFAEWWSENGYYAGKPALKTLLAEIQSSMAGVAARASPVPNGAIAEPAGFAAIRAVQAEWNDE